MRPCIYIAGPYRVPCPVQNTRTAAIAGMEIYDSLDCDIVIPHLSLLTDMICPRSPEYWLKFTLDQLRRCDAVFRLPGFSTGSDGEVAEANFIGIPVFHDRDELTHWVANWKEDATNVQH